MSIATAVKPVTFRSTPYSSSQPVVLRAQLAHELGGGRVVGRGLGHELDDAGVGGLVGRRERDGLDARELSISSARSSISPSGSVEVTIVPVMMSGPLKPGPKCSAIRS